MLVPSGPGGAYTFRDVVALRVVRSLLDAGLSSARVVVAVQALRSIGEDDLASLRLVTDGRRVWACHDDGQILDALAGGQLALFIGVDQVAAEVGARVHAFEADKAAFVDRLVQPG